MHPLFPREKCVDVCKILDIVDKESSVFLKVFCMKHSQISQAMSISKTPRIELLA